MQPLSCTPLRQQVSSDSEIMGAVIYFNPATALFALWPRLLALDDDMQPPPTRANFRIGIKLLHNVDRTRFYFTRLLVSAFLQVNSAVGVGREYFAPNAQ